MERRWLSRRSSSCSAWKLKTGVGDALQPAGLAQFPQHRQLLENVQCQQTQRPIIVQAEPLQVASHQSRWQEPCQRCSQRQHLQLLQLPEALEGGCLGQLWGKSPS